MKKLIIGVLVLCIAVVGLALLQPSPTPVVETNMEYRIMENVDM